MLTLRQRIFVVSGIVVGLILAILLLYYFVFKAGSQPRAFVQLLLHSAATEEETSGKITEAQTDADKSPTVFVKYSPEVYAKQVARMFVERFNSYSNQNNNQHIDDVLPLATDKMKKWIIAQSVAAGSVYEGVTTRVVASQVVAISADRATVAVDVQQEKKNKIGSEVVQRSGRVELVSVGEEWKVDGLYWNK